MIKVVLDTNVFVSAILAPRSVPADILGFGLEGKFRWIISPQIIEEIERVIRYPEIVKLLEQRNLSPKKLSDLMGKIKKVCVIAAGEPILEVIQADPDDNIILACAVEGKADFIVSGDHHLKDLKEFKGIHILDPAVFLKVIEKLEFSGGND